MKIVIFLQFIKKIGDTAYQIGNLTATQRRNFTITNKISKKLTD